MFTFNDREFTILENYAISRYRSNSIYYALVAGVIIMSTFIVLYYLIEFVYVGVTDLQGKVNLLA